MKETIKAAIERGQAALDEKRRVQEAEAQKQREENARREAEHAAYGDRWVEEELPAIIEELTALGNRSYYLHSDWHKSKACERAGLKVTSTFQRAEHDPDGCYSHDDRWVYTVHW